MLPSLRHAVSRTILKRGLSTATERPEDLLRASFATTNKILGANTIQSLDVLNQSALPLRRSLKQDVAPIINIPPAEDPLLHYLTSCILKHGHRQKAARITSRVLLYIHTLTRAPSLPILRQAVTAVAPAVRCISNKHAGKTVVYPVALNEKQRTRYALRWILAASESRAGQQLEERLAKEVIAIIRGIGDKDPSAFSPAYKRKEEVHKYATMNRGNAQRNA